MINDSELSRQAEENFKQYQQLWRNHIKVKIGELACCSREQMLALDNERLIGCNYD